MVIFGQWWLRNNFRPFIPLQSLRSWLRGGVYSTVMLNIGYKAADRIAKEPIA